MTKIRYLISKRGRGGRMRYYWQPSRRLRQLAWPIQRLSDDFAEAVLQAEERNRALDRWRLGNPGAVVLGRAPRRAPLSQGLYVAQAGTGPVKIGIAADPEKRLLSLQSGASLPLALHFFLRLPDGQAAALESTIHHHLRHARQTGEWFNCTPAEAITAALEHFARLSLSDRV